MKPIAFGYSVFAWLTSLLTGPVFWLCLQWVGERLMFSFPVFYGFALLTGAIYSLPALLLFIGINHLILKGAHSPNEVRGLVSLAGVPLVVLTFCLFSWGGNGMLDGFDAIRLTAAYGLPLLISIWFYPFD
jgi:hypothetical protein